MNIFKEKLLNEYANEYQNEYGKMKSGYLFSKPKIYDAGGDMSKRWYVYFSYRNSQTGKMERQAPVYLNVNRIKDFAKRKRAIKALRDVLEKMLKEGNVPTAYQTIMYSESKDIMIHEAIALSIKDAKARMKESSFRDYDYRIQKFEKWLNERQFYGKSVLEITKRTLMNFLNDTLERTSPKTRNNFKSILSIFFTFLEKNEYVPENIVDKIDNIAAKPERNKTYTSTQEQLIFDTLRERDKDLLLFIKFVSYNLLRPIEVCRLKVKNIDFANSQLTIETKNKPVKIKIIPKILMAELDFLKGKNPNHFLFTPYGVGQWEISEVNRRDYWTKRFSKIKKQLGLGKDYTMYSFRHTFITKLYRELRNEYPPYETKSRLMLITGHHTMDALEKYLRDIDAELPEDYSHLLT